MLMMYRHDLRVSEAVGLRRDHVNLAQARVWVPRLKNSLSVEQPIAGDELRAIKRYFATRADKLPWSWPYDDQCTIYAVTGKKSVQWRRQIL